MAKNKSTEGMRCPFCGGAGIVPGGDRRNCPSCGAAIKFGGAEVKVEGASWKQVLAVMVVLVILVFGLLALLATFGVSIGGAEG